MRSSYKKNIYESRVIEKIYDNYLLKVSKSFGKKFQGVVTRTNYFVFDSNKFNLKWSNGKGFVKIFNNVIVGFNTKFMEYFQKGDKIFLANPNDVSKYFHISSTNPKFNYFNNDCIIEKVISDSFIITKKPCKKVNSHKGDYFYAKSLFEYRAENNDQLNSTQILQSIIDVNTVNAISISKQYRDFYTSKYLFHPGFLLKNNSDSTINMEFTKM